MSWRDFFNGAASAFNLFPGEAPGKRPKGPKGHKGAYYIEGCPNLHSLDDGVYRGAQPTAEGFRNLWNRGIYTVINLRSAHSDRDLIRGTGLAYFEIPMRPWDVDERKIRKFLKIILTPGIRPVFFHCEHGADRTGVMAAAYRVAVHCWSVEVAIDEMVYGPFGFHNIWFNLPFHLRLWGMKRRFQGIMGKRRGQAADWGPGFWE